MWARNGDLRIKDVSAGKRAMKWRSTAIEEPVRDRRVATLTSRHPNSIKQAEIGPGKAKNSQGTTVIYCYSRIYYL